MPGQVPHAAIVSHSAVSASAPGRYLQLDGKGAARWINDPEAATAFDSMREAFRAAARLPAALRAYGVPRHTELMVGRELH
ncbi:MAG: hypothetical protein ACHP84_07555 [Caulobacterales bacterium]